MTCSPMPGTAPAFGLRGSAHALGDLQHHDGGVLAVAGQLGDLDALAGACRADQRPSGLDAHEVRRADGEAWPQDRPARGAGRRARGLGGHDGAAERLAGGAQLGQDERVFEGALGVEGGLGALQLVEPGRGSEPRGPGGAGEGRRRPGRG